MTNFSLIQAQKLSAIKFPQNQNFNPVNNQSQPNSIFDVKQSSGRSALGNFAQINPSQQQDSSNPFNFGSSSPVNQNQQTDSAGQGNILQMLMSLLQKGGLNNSEQPNTAEGNSFDQSSPISAAQGVAPSHSTQSVAPSNSAKSTDKANDAKKSESQPLASGKEHFEKFGKKEGRTYTNEEDYLKNNPDVKAAIMRGKDPAADPKDMDEKKYLEANPDVAKAIKDGSYKGTGLDHYKEFGSKEGRYTSPEEAQKYLDKAKGTDTAKPAETPLAEKPDETAKETTEEVTLKAKKTTK